MSYKDIPYSFTSLYGAAGVEKENEKAADELWESITTSGVVALKHSDSAAWELPSAQAFPWDKNYGLYVVSGIHSLHCLVCFGKHFDVPHYAKLLSQKKARRSTVLAHRGKPQVDDYHHLLHCFDFLRQDILCHADDTPMFSAGYDTNLTAGEGQVRQCRDWNRLQEFVEDNTACFAYINETQGVSDEIERYKYCPKDSPFAPTMRKHFGLPDDWYEEPVETVPSY